ncbi:MAG: preprotein translocase subunit SecA, partial [Deltaproteobacteria bacterium]
NPKEEYKREAYQLFMDMMGRIRQEVVQMIFRVQLMREEEVERIEQEERKQRLALGRTGGPAQPRQPAVNPEKIGRNDPCPCGSGKKYKKCCGQ